MSPAVPGVPLLAVENLTILDAQSRKPQVRAEDVDGFVWVPLHPHRLAVATCGLYGKASLVLWEGGTHWRSLHRVRRPEGECFELLGVTGDGRQIVYVVSR